MSSQELWRMSLCLHRWEYHQEEVASSSTPEEEDWARTKAGEGRLGAHRQVGSRRKGKTDPGQGGAPQGREQARRRGAHSMGVEGTG